MVLKTPGIDLIFRASMRLFNWLAGTTLKEPKASKALGKSKAFPKCLNCLGKKAATGVRPIQFLLCTKMLTLHQLKGNAMSGDNHSGSVATG